MQRPNTVTMQCIVLFSHGTLQMPARAAQRGACVRRIGRGRVTRWSRAGPALTIPFRVPVRAGGRVQPRPRLLHDDARHDVLELLAQPLQPFEGVVDDLLGVHGDLLVVVARL